ncbi:hypothetical protein AUEXF2481DRAFT_9438 [Aureobasidium subglaciale EXF-2481]|uniref:Major facilitator superfamily (MFS) profile domain-containing protein n=1 Tax=Aureobasidium subglaciale (strain EXF-2481) TaxID=1043005 RepID=A0A074XY82_AURSE|nr:uncharacterized protein AUEXF2481DRAFT_9438 [Aureobasidium subglaciale EXF-2481]KAI5195379.1 hypothetical protein E4T38_09109 [Aureobasidium subglaciale]KAI5214416.1 hypothetical protein E4T40_09020 [Aureobasidium subglaciale]KAI5217016.1 hypothetical protein E4T41_09022 [Aureobasidium subglaciale]KAI5254740.1 hypothetical protein E4T46_09056 [Aureobasidium subglaciale]KEQ90435.1 hypothetical protein AUEXF2481DRAFT_9438 [Aureobasidium subglaciale EXF-2481]
MLGSRLSSVLRWAKLFIICCIFSIDIANLGMVNIALPSIREDLDFDEGSLQWILTADSLTYGSFLMVGGRAGDLFSLYHIILVGLTIFNVSTLACALVSDCIGLVVARAFQGLGASLTVPCAQASISILFPEPHTRVKAYAIWGATGSTGFV